MMNSTEHAHGEATRVRPPAPESVSPEARAYLNATPAPSTAPPTDDIIAWRRLASDPEVWNEQAARNQAIASLPRTISRAVREGAGDSELGNLITDAQLAYAQKRNAEDTPIDIALTNAGGIRADLTAKSENTTITHSDLFTVQPFNNDLIALTLTGAELRQLIQR